MTKDVLQIREFIFDNFLFSEEVGDLQNDESLLDLGIIDSTGVLELVEWLENFYGIEVDDDELLPENLDSVNNLSKFIGKKTRVKRNGTKSHDCFIP